MNTLGYFCFQARLSSYITIQVQGGVAVKRYVTDNHDEYLVIDISELMTTYIGKKIYSKFMNSPHESALSWLQGVVDIAQIANLDIPGLSNLWNDVSEYGVDAVRSAVVE